MMQLYANSKKSCYRCGTQFDTCERERVCPNCRKSNVLTLENKKLTFREKQVIYLVIQAKSNKQIAHELLLTEGTIKEYLNRIFRKVEVKNRTELAVWALMQQAAA